MKVFLITEPTQQIDIQNLILQEGSPQYLHSALGQPLKSPAILRKIYYGRRTIGGFLDCAGGGTYLYFSKHLRESFLETIWLRYLHLEASIESIPLVPVFYCSEPLCHPRGTSSVFSLAVFSTFLLPLMESDQKSLWIIVVAEHAIFIVVCRGTRSLANPDSSGHTYLMHKGEEEENTLEGSDLCPVTKRDPNNRQLFHFLNFPGNCACFSMGCLF